MDCSIVIPLYNINPIYFRECLCSCINQNFTGTYEILLISDGSLTTTQEQLIIAEFNRPDLIKYHVKVHAGIANTRKYAMHLAKGKYIIIIDLDDIMMKHRLTTLFNYMETHPECTLACHGIEFIRFFDNVKFAEHYSDSIITRFIDKFHNPYTMNVIRYYQYNKIMTDINDLNIYTQESLQLSNIPASYFSYMFNSNCILRKSDYEKLNIAYQSLFDKIDDFKLTYNILKEGKQVHIRPELTGYYRQHKLMTSATDQSEMQAKIIGFHKVEWEERIKNVNNKKVTVIVFDNNNNNELEEQLENIRLKTDNVYILIVTTNKKRITKIADFYLCDILEVDKKMSQINKIEYAIHNIKTEYFLLTLFNNIRFLTKHFDTTFVQHFEKNTNSIILPFLNKYYTDEYGLTINCIVNNNIPEKYDNWFDIEHFPNIEDTCKSTNMNAVNIAIQKNCFDNVCFFTSLTVWDTIIGSFPLNDIKYLNILLTLKCAFSNHIAISNLNDICLYDIKEVINMKDNKKDKQMLIEIFVQNKLLKEKINNKVSKQFKNTYDEIRQIFINKFGYNYEKHIKDFIMINKLVDEHNYTYYRDIDDVTNITKNKFIKK